MLRAALTAAATGATLALLAAPVAAWSPPQGANPAGSEARTPSVAMNRAGVAASAWVQGPWRRRAITVSVRSQGGRWEAPLRVSPRGGVAIDPRIGVDAAGGVVVLWRQATGRQRLRIGGRVITRANWVARARTRAPDGTWGDVVTLSPRRLKVGVPALAVDPSGDAVAVWHWGTGTDPRLAGFVGQVQAATLRRDGWGAPRRLSGVSGCAQERRPRVAVGSRGHAVVWWQCDVRGGSTAFSTVRGPGEERWSPRRELPFRTRSDQRADLGVAADGSVTAISAARGGPVRFWRGAIGTQGLRLVALPQPVRIERIEDGAQGPHIDVAASGDALGAWVSSGGRGVVRAAPVAAALGAGTPTTLIGGGPARGIGVRLGSERRGVVVWVERAGTARAAVVAAARDDGGNWSAPRRLSASGSIVIAGSPRVAAAGDAAIVMWERVLGGRRVVERAEFPGP